MSNRNRNLYIAKFDEINALAKTMYTDYVSGKKDEKQIEEEFEDFLLYAYSVGFEIGAEDIGLDSETQAIYRQAANVNTSKVKEAMYRRFENRTDTDRLRDHLENDDGESSVERVLTTSWHRMANEGINGFGELYGSNLLTKTWKSMKDEKVRDTHDYLDGMTVGFDEDFYTYNGDHAKYPGLFGVPEEDVNCRCLVQLSLRQQA